MMKITRRQLQFSLLLSGLTASASLLAQTRYPAKPITIIVSYPAGGDTDVVARLFAEKLSARFQQPVLVDNKTGASGTIGNAFVSRAAPDGYTLLLTPGTFSTAQLVLKTGGGASYDVLNGFTPIIQTGNVPLYAVTTTDSGLKSLKAVVDAAKKTPLAFGTPGSGSPMHILGENFKKVAQIDLIHVPYRGVAPVTNDMLGGQLPFAILPLGPIAPYLSNGRLLALAVADGKRSPLQPNVPTFAELGYPGMEAGSWQGLLGPRGLPVEVVTILNHHMNEILRDPVVIARLASLGTVAAGGTPNQLGQANADNFEKFGKLIKELKIQAE